MESHCKHSLILAMGLVLATFARPATAGHACVADDVADAVPAGPRGSATGSFALACGGTASGRLSTTVGSGSSASGAESTAIGSGAQADAAYGTALGSFAGAGDVGATAVGTVAKALGAHSTAVGSWIDRDGNGVVTPDLDLDGDGVPDASTEQTLAATERSSALGTGAHARGERSTAVGSESQAVGDDSVALGHGSRATAVGSVALGQDAIADRANTVSVGSSTQQRQVTNVAAGTQASDAVNVAQMQSGDAATLSAANAYTDARVGAITGMADDFNAFRRDVDDRFHHQDERINRTGAMSTAMIQMGINTAAGQTQRGRIAVGAGFQGGERALSVGYGKRIGPRVSFSLGGAFSSGEKSAGLGFGLDL